jgi:acyl-CoA reductase-like NAD-dependent aldehyde dehydrogenase
MTKDMVDWPAHVIDGREEKGVAGDAAISLDPYDGVVRWSAADASATQIDDAIGAARSAFSTWSALTIDERAAIIEQFTKLVQSDAAQLADLIASEAGKPLWESKVEVNSLVTKFAASMEAYRQRNTEFGREVRGLQSRTRFRPHGVLAVLGPFNFPVSMANGHIMPALLAGNTVVYKPSELTPLAGIAVARLWQKAGLGTLVTPGLIDVSRCTTDRDEEIFGPILKVYRYSDFEQAIELANDTQYGLASGIVCRDRDLFDRFFRSARAGIVNWNQQLTGATTFAPFGGIKHSGNFRPAGFLSADYCSYAVASFEVAPNTLALPTIPGIRF